MEKICSVYFCLALLVCFIASGSAIKCFQCTTAEDPNCADLKQNDTNSKYFRECADNFGLKPFFCRKTSITILETKMTRVSRSCGTISHKKNESNCYRADTDFKSEISCQCFSDGCNSVSFVKASVSVVVLTCLAATFYANI